MSRAQRRASIGKARSRRIPVSPTSKRRLGIPWVPLTVIGGVAAAVGLMAYLIWQVGQPPGVSSDAKAAANADPNLPGEWIDLAKIYGEDSAAHRTSQVDFVADGNSNPPAGGPMWGSSSCGDDPQAAPAYCGPAPWGIFRKPWEPETLNHNMEHGGVAIYYNTSHRSFLDELEDFIIGRLKDGDRLVLTPYTEMEKETIAVASWSRIDRFPVSEFSEDRVKKFIKAHECRYDEGTC